MPSLDEAHRREKLGHWGSIGGNWKILLPRNTAILQKVLYTTCLLNLERLDTTIWTLVFSLSLLCRHTLLATKRSAKCFKMLCSWTYRMCSLWRLDLSKYHFYCSQNLWRTLSSGKSVDTWSILVVEPAISVLNRSLYQINIFLQRFCR